MTNPPHARTSDLPGWPTPPRARDIATKEGGWGWVPTGKHYGNAHPAGVVQDELGRLWANGNFVPKYQMPTETNADPGAILFWTEQGIGLYIHPKSYPFLGSLNTYDMEPDQWVPIVAVAEKLPDFVQDAKR